MHQPLCLEMCMPHKIFALLLHWLPCMKMMPSFSHAAADFLTGKIGARGTLPVTVCNHQYGTGMAVNRFAPVGTSYEWAVVDSIVQDGLTKKAYPGAVVLAVQGGVIKYHKAFGNYRIRSRIHTCNIWKAHMTWLLNKNFRYYSGRYEIVRGG